MLCIHQTASLLDMLLVRSEYVESLVRELKLLVEYICKIRMTIPLHTDCIEGTIKLIQTLENWVLFSWRKRMALIKQQLEDPSTPSSSLSAGASGLDSLWQSVGVA